MTKMGRLVCADIGGTHARFALAEVADGIVTSISEATTLATADFANLEQAWQHFAQLVASPLPNAAALGVASPIRGDILKFTNSPWVIDRREIAEALGIERSVIVNDFEAVGHAVALAGSGDFTPVAGPTRSPQTPGLTSIIGPGTGLGIAQLLRLPNGYHVQASEGGHTGFAPVDAVDDLILSRLRQQHDRVSVERVVSGAGLGVVYQAIAAMEGVAVDPIDDKALWTLALGGEDPLASAALDRFCMLLGGVAGDIALVQGAHEVVIAGGLGYRLRHILHGSRFYERFCAKGRYESLMASLPVMLLTLEQPGLIGAAAAFARHYPSPN